MYEGYIYVRLIARHGTDGRIAGMGLGWRRIGKFSELCVEVAQNGSMSYGFAEILGKWFSDNGRNNS
jgi:hypothetical protein